jgi:hypothetical protein
LIAAECVPTASSSDDRAEYRQNPGSAYNWHEDPKYANAGQQQTGTVTYRQMALATTVAITSLIRWAA